MTVALLRGDCASPLYALAASTACSRAPQQEAAARQRRRATRSCCRRTHRNSPVSTVEVAKAEPVAAALEAVGTVALDDTRTARVGALVEGVVDATRVNVGDRVRAGALLAGLHSHEVHDGWGDYRKAVADRRRVEQELAFASETVARTERLLADKAASVLEVERARSMRAGAVEQLAVANAEVQRARESLEHLGIPTGSTTDGPSCRDHPGSDAAGRRRAREAGHDRHRRDPWDTRSSSSATRHRCGCWPRSTRRRLRR